MNELYLYFGLLIGTFIEGEATLIAAGFAGHRELMNPYLVFLIAILGVQATDWFHYLLGKYAGSAIIKRKPWLKLKLDKMNNYLVKYDRIILFGFRFMYGTRTIMPFAIGMSPISTRKFALFSFIAAVCWSATYTLFGYFAGHMMTTIFGEIKQFEWPVILSILSIGIIIYAIKTLKFRYRSTEG